MTSPVLSSFQIQAIIMIESNFKRKDIIDFTKEQKPSLDLKTSYLKTAEGLYCLVELAYKASIDGETVPVVEASIKIGGNFIKQGEGPIDIDTFGKVNAPAIIYPFIREQLSSLSLKASLTPILLPPVNFQAVSEQNTAKKQ